MVGDQRGRPTGADGLAVAVAFLAGRDDVGILHVAGDGAPCTWAELAELAVGHPVEHVTTDEWGAAAPRPAQLGALARACAQPGRASDRLAGVAAPIRGGPVKGVVLAGGYGTRLAPMTRVVNKHLLDVFDQPMVYYPIQSLARAGITDVVLVTGDEIEQFQALLGDGSELGVSLTFVRQDGAGGIAAALGLVAPHADGPVVAMLGDNLYQDDLTPYVDAFRAQGGGARILLKQVEDARRFGVARVDGERIVEIVEKPEHPASDLAVTGCYMYDQRVFEIVAGLQPSDRGELEITDVNNAYMQRGELHFDVLPGWWTDAGTYPSKLKASILVALTKGVTFHA